MLIRTLFTYMIFTVISFGNQSKAQENKRYEDIVIGFDAYNHTILRDNVKLRISSETLAPELRESTYEALRYALDKYPKEFLQQNIKKIFLVSDLKADGNDWGATFDEIDQHLVIHSDSIYTFKRQFALEHNIHHAIFGIVYSKDLNELYEQWTQVNPYFRYSKSKSLGFSDNKNKDYTHALFKKGILDHYAKSSFVNDMKSYFSNLMLPDIRFWRAYANYKYVRNKTDLLIEYLNKKDMHFNKSYFKRFNSEAVNLKK